MLCAVYPTAWQLMASGFTDVGGGSCTCQQLNRTWTLLDTGACLWQDKTATVSLQLASQMATLTLKAQGGTVTYTQFMANWNCCQANTLMLSGASCCGGAPPSLTLTPTDCACTSNFCGVCTQCDAVGFPQVYQVVGPSGFVD